MTRITDFGRKRTYLEATSQAQAGLEKTAKETAEPQNVDGDDLALPPKKKRKRTKPSMRDGNTGVKAAEAAVEREKKRLEAEARAAEGIPSKSAKKRIREKAKKEKKVFPASEWRRLKRIDERLDKTICYACRQKGHAAKDCPNTEKPTEDSQNAQIVGICYRCGSSKHTLSRCKKSVDQANPLPFASCFVCNGKGHLASSCPQNKEKGIYPNGGCCKLCGDTTHLARDCGLRKEVKIETKDILGTGDATGADEDDFHSSRRQKGEIDRSEKHEEKKKRAQGHHFESQSNTTKTTTHASLPSKRVVNF